MRISIIQPGIFPVVALLVAATATGCLIVAQRDRRDAAKAAVGKRK